MYFIVGLILSVISSVKVTRHYTIWLFFYSFLIFPLQFSRYILREFLCRCLLIDTGVENFVGKGYRNIPTENFCRCFYLYLLIFW